MQAGTGRVTDAQPAEGIIDYASRSFPIGGRARGLGGPTRPTSNGLVPIDLAATGAFIFSTLLAGATYCIVDPAWL